MRIVKKIIFIFGIGFILNLFWEFSHSLLYALDLSVTGHLLCCLRAAFGDAVYITLLYLIFLKLFKIDLVNKIHLKQLLFWVVIIGFIVAYLIELHALSTGRWSYNDFMPLVPLFKVGLTPFIQLSITSVLSYAIVKRILKKSEPDFVF